MASSHLKYSVFLLTSFSVLFFTLYGFGVAQSIDTQRSIDTQKSDPQNLVQQQLSQQQSNQAPDPRQLLSTFPNGGEQLTTNVLNALNNDPSLTAAVLVLFDVANDAQRRAITDGIGKAMSQENAQFGPQIASLILSENANGGSQLSSVVEAIMTSYPSLAKVFVSQSSGAASTVKNAVAIGLGNATQQLATNDSLAAADDIIKAALASTDPAFTTMFNEVSGNLATAAITANSNATEDPLPVGTSQEDTTQQNTQQVQTDQGRQAQSRQAQSDQNTQATNAINNQASDTTGDVTTDVAAGGTSSVTQGRVTGSVGTLSFNSSAGGSGGGGTVSPN